MSGPGTDFVAFDLVYVMTRYCRMNADTAWRARRTRGGDTPRRNQMRGPRLSVQFVPGAWL
eukprot:3004510-Rhodomonas_salina.1